MPVITLSALSAIKGFIFLSKTTAIKTLIFKNGALIVGKLGIGGTITTATTAAALTGTAVTIASLPKNTKDGFKKIMNGILKRSAADFFEGLTQVASSYSTLIDFGHDIFNYIDAIQLDPEIKVEIKATLKDMKGLIQEEIENKTICLLREFEDLLRLNGYTTEEYLTSIDIIYHSHTDFVWDDYGEILGRGGRIYEDIMQLNIKYGLSDGTEYDHYLIYCIAGWILTNIRHLNCLVGISQKRLAGDITDNIFAYLRAMEKV